MVIMFNHYDDDFDDDNDNNRIDNCYLQTDIRIVFAIPWHIAIKWLSHSLGCSGSFNPNAAGG